MKNALMKLEKLVDAHNRSQTTTIIENPYEPSQVISIGHDSFIRVWNSSDLSVVRTVRVFSPYLTSIVAFQGNFLVGIGNGSLLVLNSQFQIQKQYPIHKDCITGILILSDKIVTVSYDGDVHFLDRNTFQITKTFHFRLPIYQCLHYQNYIYITSEPCYKINEKTYQTIQVGKYNQFVVHDGQIYGCSDQKGIQCLNNKVCFQVPCEYMISFGPAIFFSAHETVGILFYNENMEPTWELSKVENFSPGCSMLSGFKKKNNVFMTGESGNIYKFKIKIQNQDEKKEQNVPQQNTKKEKQ